MNWPTATFEAVQALTWMAIWVSSDCAMSTKTYKRLTLSFPSYLRGMTVYGTISLISPTANYYTTSKDFNDEVQGSDEEIDQMERLRDDTFRYLRSYLNTPLESFTQSSGNEARLKIPDQKPTTVTLLLFEPIGKEVEKLYTIGELVIEGSKVLSKSSD